MEAANGAGWLAAMLGDPDARSLITPEQISEFRENLLRLSGMAEEAARGGL